MLATCPAVTAHPPFPMSHPPTSSPPSPFILPQQLAGLEVVKTVVQDSPHKLFIGGLPCDWSEEQVRVWELGWVGGLACWAGAAWLEW